MKLIKNNSHMNKQVDNDLDETYETYKTKARQHNRIKMNEEILSPCTGHSQKQYNRRKDIYGVSYEYP